MDMLIKVDILEVKNPWQFTGRIVLPWERDAYEEARSQWQNEMQTIEKETVLNQDIHRNELCAVKDKHETWYRVLVKEIFYTLKGQQARCLFVDTGQQKDICLPRLFHLPKTYHSHKVPFQMRTMKLWGLQPISLQIEVTDSGLHVPHRVSNKWDAAAETFFRKVTEQCGEASVKVRRQDNRGNLHVELFVCKNNTPYNINEALIEEEYACAISSEDSTDMDDSPRSKDLTEREQKHLHQNRLSFSSDSSLSCSRKSPQYHQTSFSQTSSTSALSDLEARFEDNGKIEQAFCGKKLQQVLAKVERVSSQSKHQLVKEDRLRTQDLKFRRESEPEPCSQTASEDSAGDNNLKPDAFTRNISVNEISGRTLSASNVGSLQDKLVNALENVTPDVVKPSLLQSESRSCSQLKTPCSRSTASKSLLPDFRCAESSPALLAEFSDIALDVHSPSVKHPALKSTSCTLPPFCNIESPQNKLPHDQMQLPIQKPINLERQSLANLPSTDVSNESPQATLNKTGRGRGLRKIFIEDFIHLSVHSVSHANSGNEHDMATSEAKSSELSQKTKSQQTGESLVNQPPSKVENDDKYKGFHAEQSKVLSLPELVNVSSVPATADRHQESVDQNSSCANATLNSYLRDSVIKKEVNNADDLTRCDQGLQIQRSMLERGKLLKNEFRSDSLNRLSDTESLSSVYRDRQRGKAMGQSLLDLLGKQSTEQSRDAKLKVPLVWRPDRPMPKPFLGTRVWGSCPPSAVYDIEEIHFNDVVKNYMLKENFKQPWSIQANSWPAVLRGRHVIGITPKDSGKTTAYLPALVTKLLENSQYLSLPEGCGPKAIILVPSSKKADKIFNYVHAMLPPGQTSLRVLHIYGCDEHYVLPLLRGCDILISTPHCLLRMLDRRYTFLDRLCHLVLDGADILVEQFTEQIREIMKIYAAKLRDYQGLLVTRQIMTFGHQWTKGVAAFQQAYQVDPVLVFASRIEASVYGRVQQVVHMCLEEVHLSILKALVEKLVSETVSRRIVIAVSDCKHLNNIEQLLKSMSVYAQVISPDSGGDVIDHKVREWQSQSGSSSVLVVADCNVADLFVTSAHVVIHFDIPNSKTKFGNRLALMFDHFHDSCGDQMTQEQSPVSHLLVTDSMLKYVESLYDFLLRSDATIPSQLARLVEGIYRGKNEDEKRTLCLQVRQFGKCDNQQKCEERHLILPCDVVRDNGANSWPPASGTVKVRILNVIDTNHFFVRLLEHQVKGQPRQDLQTIHISLIMDLARHMTNPKNQLPYFLEQGFEHLVAVKDDDSLFHRARVISTLCENHKSERVEVNYVDEGRTLRVRPEQLFKLPPELQQVPPLAVEVFLSRVKPVDGDSNWTLSSKNFVKEQLEDKDAYGTIVLRMQNTLWLDPIAQQTRLKFLQMSIISMTLRSELLNRGLAEDNPDHIKNLYRLSEGMIDIPQSLYEKYLHLPPHQKIETERLISSAESHEVCISVVDHPHHFYVQIHSLQKELDRMNEELKKHMEDILKAHADVAALDAQAVSSQTDLANNTPVSTEATPSAEINSAKEEITGQSEIVPSHDLQAEEKTKEFDFEVGSVCVAKFDNESWYRGRIVEKLDEGWRVFFLDYGERNLVAESDIHYLPDQFCVLPAQAIECSLGLVKSTGGEWDEKSGDALWDLCHYVDGDQKILLAKGLETQEAEYAKPTKHVIELYDNSSSREVRLSQELVRAHLAFSEDETVTDLFPKATFNRRKVYPSFQAKLIDMCSALYWTEIDEKAKDLSILISDGLLTYFEMGSYKESDQQVLQTVVQLVGYLKCLEAHLTLLSAILKCVKMDQHVCADAIGEELVLHLVFCLEQTRNPEIQIQAAAILADLAKLGLSQCLDQEKIIQVFSYVLKAVDPAPEMLKHACSILMNILSQSTKYCEIMESLGVVQTVVDLLPENNDVDVQETQLSLLSAMAELEVFHASLVRESAIQRIIDVMQETPSHKCIFYCARIWQSVCHNSRRNKRILLEKKLVLVVKSMLDSGLQSPARELCHQLVETLAVPVFQHETLSGVRITSQGVTDSQSLKAPPVKWSQNSFRVLMTVSVRGAKESDFKISQNEIHCRCELVGTVYGFDYVLFGDLIPEKCRVDVSLTEVSLSLAKQKKGMWNRLLKDKQKRVNLTVDYDNIVDSSDSEVEETENVRVLARKKRRLFPKQEEPDWKCQYDFSYGEESSCDSYADLGSDSDDERYKNLVDPQFLLENLMAAEKSSATE